MFVVGVGRSGTSLLQSMLAAHPAVAFMPETAFLRRYVATGALSRCYATGGRESAISALAGDEAFQRAGLDASILVDQALAEPAPLEVSVYRQMVRSRYSPGVAWVGDKDPRLIELQPLIAALFPNPAVINIIRDPRDVLLSKKRAAWSKDGHVWKHIFANRVQLELGRSRGPRLFGNNYHEIIYEELIAAPQEVLSELCRRMGLPFDAAMLSFGDAARKLVFPSELSWKKETFGPLLRTNKEKWKTGLSQREIALAQLCCREALAVGNFKLDDRKRRLAWLDKLWVLAGDLVIRLAHWPYRYYLNYQVTRACKRTG